MRLLNLWRGIGWLGVALVAVLSLIPVAGPPLGFDYSDKLAHLLCYAILAWWFAQLTDKTARVWLGLFVLGAGLEVIQGWMPYRSAGAWDLLADVVGVGGGWWLAQTQAGRLLAWLDERLSHGG